MSEYENIEERVVEKDIEYIANRIEGTRMFDHFWMNRQMPSTVVYYFTSYTFLKDYCKTRFPVTESSSALHLDNCALAHTNEKGNPDAIPHQIFKDFENMEDSRVTRKRLDSVCKVIMEVGIIVSMCFWGKDIKIPMKFIIWLVFILNTLLCYPALVEQTERYGIDYVAYIQ